jgi:trans-2-enoyl-CoA reductase
MQALRIAEFGEPDEVVRVDEIDEPGPPGEGQVNVAVEFAPIHPSDLLMIRGGAGPRPTMPATTGQLPAVLGTEGVGRVVRVGPRVQNVVTGDRVLTPFNYPSWAEVVTIPARGLFALPEEIDGPQLAALTINPMTAYVMLDEYVSLRPGEWVIQNVANSSVGRALIAIARTRGLRTVNVVRRAGLEADLTALGADVVIVDGADLGVRVRQATDNAAIRLGLDAVAGESTMSMASCLTRGGTLVSYGAMGASPCSIAARQLIVNDLTLRGFWLVSWMEHASVERMIKIQRDLLALLADGTMRTPVTEVVPLSDATAAMKHAMTGKGKTVLAIGA